MAEHAGVERYLQTLERAKEEEQDAASQVRDGRGWGRGSPIRSRDRSFSRFAVAFGWDRVSCVTTEHPRVMQGSPYIQSNHKPILYLSPDGKPDHSPK